MQRGARELFAAAQWALCVDANVLAAVAASDDARDTVGVARVVNEAREPTRASRVNGPLVVQPVVSKVSKDM